MSGCDLCVYTDVVGEIPIALAVGIIVGGGGISQRRLKRELP